MTRARTRANGDGDVYPRKNKDGKVIGYQGSYWLTDPATGGRKRRYVSGKTKAETRNRLARAKAEADARGGLFIPGEDVTLAEYLSRWLSGPLKTRNLKHATIEQYERQVRNHIVPALGRVKLQRLTAHMLQDLYDEKMASGMAPGSVRQLHVVLHSALSHAHKHDVVTQNAAAKTDPPKVCPPEIQPLSSDEARSLLSAARGDRLEALYVLAVTAGLRIGELLGLRWEDVDLDAGVLRVARTLTRAKGGTRFTTPKSGKGRSIALTSKAIEALKNHRKSQNEERLRLGALWKDNGLVFALERGTPLDASNLDKRSFKLLLKRAEVRENVRFHDLRHTCATLLLGRGVHPKFVQELLGHASIAITLDRYSHWIPSMGAETARAMDAVLG
jgi:integrase